MSDRCLFSFYETSSGKTVDWTDRVVGQAGPNQPYEDALKFTSNLRDFVGEFGEVYGGLENCADVNNHCRNIYLSANIWYANLGKYPFTVKGGSEGVNIFGFLVGHGTECDVDAGNWSDQGNQWVKNWELDLRSADDKPIVVRCLQAEAPRFAEGSGPYVFAFPSPLKWYHGIAVWCLQLWWKITK